MSNKGKTILILGNGFDLAHNLPTTYSHFLNFCKEIDKMQLRCSIIQTIMIKTDSEKTYEIPATNKKLFEFSNLLKNNIWYLYFIELYTNNLMKGENWINFEFEIRYIIKTIDENSLSIAMHWDEVINEAFLHNPNDIKLAIFYEKFNSGEYQVSKGWKRDYQVTIKDFREKAFEDLENLIRALELYLSFVEEIPITDKLPELSNITPDYVINFNYTNTYERIYKKEDVYHIHGKANADHSKEDNNMVLGIDEYWGTNERNERTNFTIFKKFSQRIQKHTGNESYKYLKEIRRIFENKRESLSPNNIDMSEVHPDEISNVYIFGHSLDITDKDILSSFIGDDSTSVIVFCKDKGTEGELIANTIRLITEEKLLEKTNHLPTKLKYKILKS